MMPSFPFKSGAKLARGSREPPSSVSQSKCAAPRGREGFARKEKRAVTKANENVDSVVI